MWLNQGLVFTHRRKHNLGHKPKHERIHSDSARSISQDFKQAKWKLPNIASGGQNLTSFSTWKAISFVHIKWNKEVIQSVE